MDIEYILNNFLKGDMKDKISPVLEMLAKNNFDISKVIKNLDVTTVAPLLGSLFEAFSARKGAAQTAQAAANPLAPISSVADRDIIYSLNRYLAEFV